MAFTIIMKNEAGELERVTAKDGREAAEKLSALVEGMELAGGDRFEIVDEEDQG